MQFCHQRTTFLTLNLQFAYVVWSKMSVKGIIMFLGMKNIRLERKILIILDFENGFLPTYLPQCIFFFQSSCNLSFERQSRETKLRLRVRFHLGLLSIQANDMESCVCHQLFQSTKSWFSNLLARHFQIRVHEVCQKYWFYRIEHCIGYFIVQIQVLAKLRKNARSRLDFNGKSLILSPILNRF